MKELAKGEINTLIWTPAGRYIKETISTPHYTIERKKWIKHKVVK